MYDFLNFEKSSKNIESEKIEDFDANRKKSKNKKIIHTFFKNLGSISECLIVRISKNNPLIKDKAKIEYLKVFFK